MQDDRPARERARDAAAAAEQPRSPSPLRPLRRLLPEKRGRGSGRVPAAADDRVVACCPLFLPPFPSSAGSCGSEASRVPGDLGRPAVPPAPVRYREKSALFFGVLSSRAGRDVFGAEMAFEASLRRRLRACAVGWKVTIRLVVSSFGGRRWRAWGSLARGSGGAG